MWSAEKYSNVYVFLENDSTNLQQFFPGLGENTMFTTICCEKYCTCPIKVVRHGHVCRVNKDLPLSELDALSQNCNTEKNIEMTANIKQKFMMLFSV